MINSQLAATLCSIMLTWLLFATVCLGLGAWYFRCSRRVAPTADDFIATFWMGFASLIAILQVWHLFRPINGWTFAALFALGIMGFTSLLPTLVPAWTSIPKGLKSAFLLPFLGLGLWIADRAIGPGNFYDSGLYHIQAQEWIEQYRIVPGLANLHFRFGYTSSMHLLSAVMDQGFWAGNANHYMNGFLLTALAAMVVRSAAGVACRDIAAPRHLLMLFCAVAVGEWGTSQQISSLSTDVGVVVLTVVSAFYFMQVFDSLSHSGSLANAAFLCVTTASVAVSMKASSLVFSGLLMLIVLVILWRFTPPGRFRLQVIAACLVSAFVLIGTWITHQAIYTGYPLYPTALFPLPVSWRIPQEQVISQAKVLLDWGRSADVVDTRKDWSWIHKWLEIRVFPIYTIWQGIAPFTIGIVALLPSAILFRRLKTLRHAWHAPVWLLLCLCVALVAWFSNAPEVRFTTQIIYLIMACGLTLLVGAIAPQNVGVAGRTVLLIVAALLGAAPCLYYKYETAQGRYGFDVWLASPGSGQFYPSPPVPALKTVTTTSGLAILAPVTGDQVWAAPIPTSPGVSLSLHLRKPGRIQSGFLQ